MVLSATAWVVMLGSISLLWVPAIWSFYRTLSEENRKIELLDKQGEIDTYSPKALIELRDWIQSHPNDEYAPEARERYNDCVEILREIDEPFYNWDRKEIESLEKL